MAGSRAASFFSAHLNWAIFLFNGADEFETMPSFKRSQSFISSARKKRSDWRMKERKSDWSWSWSAGMRGRVGFEWEMEAGWRQLNEVEERIDETELIGWSQPGLHSLNPLQTEPLRRISGNKPIPADADAGIRPDSFTLCLITLRISENKLKKVLRKNEMVLRWIFGIKFN